MATDERSGSNCESPCKKCKRLEKKVPICRATCQALADIQMEFFMTPLYIGANAPDVLGEFSISKPMRRGINPMP